MPLVRFSVGVVVLRGFQMLEAILIEVMMEFSREEIMAEIERRQSAKAGYQFTPTQVREEINRRQSSPTRAVARPLAIGATAVTDRLAENVGAVPDLVASGMRFAGLPAPEDPNYYANKLKQGLEAMRSATRPLDNALGTSFGNGYPANLTEEIAAGAGRTVGDALTMLAPAGAVAKTAKQGTVTANVANKVSQQPLLQLFAAGTGGAVEGGTGSELAGLATSVATPFSVAGARRAATPVINQLSGQEQRLAKAATDAGIQLTPGQLTGSHPLQTLESTLSQMPLSSGRQTAIFDNQRKAFTRAVLKKAGIEADEATPEILDAARKRLGDEFDNLAELTEVVADEALADDIANVADEYGRRLSADQAPVFKSFVDDLNKLQEAAQLPDVTSVFIPGREYQNLTSKIKRTMRSTNDPGLEHALGDLVGAVESAMQRSMSPDVASRWQQTRAQWNNLRIIREAMAGGTQESRKTATIPFAAFKNAVAKGDRQGFATGRGELNELARVGDFLGPTIPDSGTPTRQFWNQLLAGGAGATGMGAMVGPDPFLALGAGATAAGVSPAVQRVFNSRLGSKYLTNQKFSKPVISKELLGKVIAAQAMGGL